MNARKIREDLGRAKTCAQKRDVVRAVYLLCISLKDLGGQVSPTPLRTDFRNAITEICADPSFKKFYSQPVSYQPGKERELLALFNKFYKELHGKADDEEYEVALARKLNLDRCINDGKAFLNQNKPQEADERFNEALKYYKNETAAFSMMARAMMDAGHYARALGYIRLGLKEKPEDQVLTRLGAECTAKRK